MHQRKYTSWVLAALIIGTLGLFAPSTLTSPPGYAEIGLAATPPMGWNSWNYYGCEIDEWKIRATADALVSSGMRDAGYQYLTIDDCWQGPRDAAGNLTSDARTFPSGMAELGAYIHSRGLKFGLYTGAGRLSCAMRPGSLGYEAQDAAQFAAWGVDFIKIDWCYTDGIDARQQFQIWRHAVAATPRPMVVSICTWGKAAPWEWGRESGQLWRTTDDIRPRWSSILGIIQQTAPLAYAAGPHGWNDPDMLQVGNGPLTLAQNRSHFAIWAMMAAPLIAGNRLDQMKPEIAAILLNREIIAVNQDPLGRAALIYRDDHGPQLWARPLADGSFAVALFNQTYQPAQMAIRWEEAAIPAGAARVRDLWSGAELGLQEGLSITLEPYDTQIFRVWPANVATPPSPSPTETPTAEALPTNPTNDSPPNGISHLSALTPNLALNAYGPVEHDQSNGEAQANDGQPLRIAGVTYARGLGVHAPAELRYRLNSRCQVLAATAGIDDEVGDQGAVIFQVWGDDRLLYDSGVVTGAMGGAEIYLAIDGIQELRLLALAGGSSTDYAHANWADARIACSD